MEDINIKSVRYPVATDEKLEKLAVQLVDYFYRTKKDPLDFNDELLKKELINGNSRIVGFIKRQESDFLLPIFTASTGLSAAAKAHSSNLKEISHHLSLESKKADQFSFRIGGMEKQLGKILNQAEEKASLKLRFKKLLEYYISQRESLGWPVSAAKKEELQQHVRTSLENL